MNLTRLMAAESGRMQSGMARSVGMKAALIAVPAVMLATAALAAPQGSGLVARPPGAVAQVRLVCDQFCNCWKTRYHERRRHERPEELSGPRCPQGGHLNFYYETGAPKNETPFDNFFGFFPPGPAYRHW